MSHGEGDVEDKERAIQIRIQKGTTWGIKVEVLASKRRLDVIIPLTLDAKRQRCKCSFRLK